MRSSGHTRVRVHFHTVSGRALALWGNKTPPQRRPGLGRENVVFPGPEQVPTASESCHKDSLMPSPFTRQPGPPWARVGPGCHVRANMTEETGTLLTSEPGTVTVPARRGEGRSSVQLGHRGQQHSPSPLFSSTWETLDPRHRLGHRTRWAAWRGHTGWWLVSGHLTPCVWPLPSVSRALPGAGMPLRKPEPPCA